MPSKMKQTVSVLLLVLTALIWGVAFVAQSVGGDQVGSFTFLCARSIIGGTALLPLVLLRRKNSAETVKKAPTDRRALWLGGVLCGTALAVASALQQIGIAETTVGKAGFITALYIVIVPIFGLFMKKRAGASVWCGVALAAVGMYLLCITDGFSISRGDFYVLLSAVCFAVHILVIDRYSPRADGVTMSCIQFFTCGVLAGVFMLIFETPSVSALLSAWLPILYAGVLSSGVGYTLQIIAQKNVPPTLASLVMSLESVFSVLAGWAILHQSLSARELIGCALVFCAILLAQLPAPGKKNN